MKQAQILIVDSEPMFRQGLKACLEKHGFIVVGETETADGALEQLSQTEPDLVIMDVSPIGGSGVAVCREMRLRKPALRVLLMAKHYNGLSGLVQMQGFLAGASGCVSKRLMDDEWYETVVQILSGRILFPDEVVWKAQPKEGLTQREVEVVVLVAQGLTNQEIAQRLVISVHTVATHVSNILSKMRASTRHEAVQTWRTMENRME